MIMHRFQCLPAHPENTRWGQGCNATWEAKPGPTECPRCGAVYVLRIA